MKINPYIGHTSQLCSVEEVCLLGGKGDGMRLLQLRNTAGLEMRESLRKIRLVGGHRKPGSEGLF